MANEFIIRKGYKSFSDSQITGSLSVTNAVTASFFSGSFRGDGSQLTGIDGFPFTGSASISGSLTVVGPVNATTFTGDGSQLTGIEGFPFTGSARITGSLVVVGSVNATSFIGSLQGTATTASYIQLTNVDGFTAYSSSVNTAIGSVLNATTPFTATVNTTNTPFTLTSQSIVVANSTNGNLIINLPDLNTVVGTPNQKPIVLYKNDYSQNVIYVNPSGSQLINGASQDLIVSIQLAVIYNPTSAGWVTEGTSAQSLAELELFFVPKTETGSLSVATASYVQYSNVANKPALVSGSSQISFSGITGKPTLVSGSAQISFTGITNKPTGIVSSSVQVKGYNVFATTGSNQFNGSQAITGSLTVTGQVIAQTLNVQEVTSSIVFSSGSNRFGNSLGNTHKFTGSLSVTGSLAIAGALSGTSGTLTGALIVENNAITQDGTRPIITLQQSGTSKVFLGISSGASDLVTGDSSGDAVFRKPASSGAFRFSVNGGSSSALTLASTGAATFSSTVTTNGDISYYNAGNLNAIITSGAAANGRMYLYASATADIGLQAGGSSWFLNNLGIGTDSPSQQLSVKKVDNLTTAIASFAANNLTQQVEIWYAGVRAGGTSTNVDLYLSSKNAGAVVCETNGTERMRITSGGNVLIGTTTDSSGKLQVLGADNAIVSQIKSASGMLQVYTYLTAADGPIIQALDGAAANFKNLRIECIATTIKGPNSIVTNGAAANINLHTTNAYGADIGGTIGFGGLFNGSASTEFAVIAGKKENATINNISGYLAFYTRAAATDPIERMRITSVGAINILDSYFRANSAGGYRFNNQADTFNNVIFYDNGNVTIRGALSKGSGSFRIDHPLPSKKDTHHLVHSFIEGPQADNIYRGKIQLVNGKATVNLDQATRMTEGTFVLLNGNTQCFTSNESGWTAVKGIVAENILTIEAQYPECTDTISWLVVGERIDQHMLDTDWTDENGKVITEPLKQ